jgi:integrase
MDRGMIDAASSSDGAPLIDSSCYAKNPGKYFDDIWFIHHVDSGEVVKIDFRSRFGELRSWQQLVAKNIVFLRCEGVDNGFATVQSPRSMSSTYGNIASVFHFMNSKFQGRLLADLSESELIELVIHNIDGSIARGPTVFSRIRLLAWMYDLRYAEHRLVPEQYLPASNLSGRWEDLCSVWVRDAGESYADWRAGGSFSIVPFEIALAVLGYCFQLIKSDETKYVLAWFQTERRLREEGRLPSWKTAGQFFSNFGERSTCYGSRLKAWSVDQVFFEELCKCYPNVKSRDQLPLPSIPFAIGTHSIKSSITRKGDHLLTACYLAILILTGIRHSEASGMARDAFEKKGADYIFASNIEKTNHGVVTDRHVSAAVADFIDVLDGLGGVGLTCERRKELFSYFRYSFNSQNQPVYSMNKNAINVTMQVNSFYEIFLEGQGDDVRNYCPHVTAHGFRHAWAEFAMRRFDGNIMPLIRDHYRHHFGSKMTGVYTHNKVELSEYQHLGRRQIFELVSRYVDGAATLHGQLGEFLTRQADNIGLVEMHDKSARDATIRQIIEEHVGEPIVTPHEYGLCVLTENTKQLANCRDEAGIPRTQTADVDSCVGCVNSCIIKQTDNKDDPHFLTLKRRLATYRAEAQEWQGNDLIGPLFVDGAQKTLRALEALVRKMEKVDV